MMKWGKRKSIREGVDIERPLTMDKDAVLTALREQLVRRMGGNYTLIISAENLPLKNVKQRFGRYMKEIRREINQFEGIVTLLHFLEVEFECYQKLGDVLGPLDDDMSVASLKKTTHWEVPKRILTSLSEDLYSKIDTHLVVNDVVFGRAVKNCESAYKTIKGLPH